MSRVHGVPPTAAGFDSVLQKHINGDFTGYIRSILDREKISKVVYQVRQPESAYPTTDFPPDRIVWTFPLIGPLQPAWAKKQGATTLGAVVQALDRIRRSQADVQGNAHVETRLQL